ncbi:hypothetical protein PIROE2DRAFT_10814, partial [Piromyces sp. E2]
ACVAHSNICRFDNPSSLENSLQNAGYDIGDLSAEVYCKIHLEVCDMIYKYDPPITDDDVFNYGKYYTCDEDDYMCKFNKNSSCQIVLKKCPENYSEDDCQKLSLVCDNIDSGVIPTFDDEENNQKEDNQEEGDQEEDDQEEDDQEEDDQEEGDQEEGDQEEDNKENENNEDEDQENDNQDNKDQNNYNEPAVEEPVVEEPIVEEPIVEEPVVEEPVAEEPVIEDVVNEPAVEDEVQEPSINDNVIQEKVKTPSGLEIPESLMVYLSCPIGDTKCKNGKSSACVAHSNICRFDNPSSLENSLQNAGYDIGDLSAEVYCKIHLEVCDMIYKYDPPITDDDVFNYGKYYTCDEDDYMCKFNKNSSCQIVLKKCPENYSEDD